MNISARIKSVSRARNCKRTFASPCIYQQSVEMHLSNHKGIPLSIFLFFIFDFESMFAKAGDSETRKGLGWKKQ